MFNRILYLLLVGNAYQVDVKRQGLTVMRSLTIFTT